MWSKINEASRAFFLKAYELSSYFLVVAGITSYVIFLMRYIEVIVLQRRLLGFSLRGPLFLAIVLIFIAIVYWLYSTISILLLEKEQLKPNAVKIGLVGIMIGISVFVFWLRTEIGHILLY